MTLTWRKDGLATALVGVAAGIYAAYEMGSALPGFGGTRVVTTAILFLGVGACAAGGGAPETSTRWQSFMGVLGGVAFTFGFAAMLWTTAPLVRLTIGAIVAIWAIATVRRTFARPAVPAAASSQRELVSTHG